MNKTELVKAIAEKANLKVSDTETMVNEFIETISNELKGGNKVTLVGFGTFAVSHRNERMGVNPKTGEKLKIAAKNVPVFKPGKSLKEKIQ